MKTGTRLQFSSLMKGVARAAGWAVVTLTAGLILAILFGSPLSESSSSSRDDLPGASHEKETGPWVYPPALVGV
jgi:hypothetical protein